MEGFRHLPELPSVAKIEEGAGGKIVLFSYNYLTNRSHKKRVVLGENNSPNPLIGSYLYFMQFNQGDWSFKPISKKADQMTKVEEKSFADPVKDFLKKREKKIGWGAHKLLARKFKLDAEMLIDTLPAFEHDFAKAKKDWKDSSDSDRLLNYKKYEKTESYLKEVIRALGLIGGSKAAAGLIDLVPNLKGDGGLQIEVAEALGLIGNEKAVKPLCQMLEDEYDKVRSKAAEVLGNIRSPQAVESLLATLKDADFGVRRATVIALGKIGDKRAIGGLIAIDQKNWDVTCEALGEINDTGDERVIGFLKEAVVLMMDRGADYAIRIAACNALGKIGDKKVIELLNSVIANDPWYLVDEETKEPVEWPVRAAAYKALNEIKERSKI